MDQSDEKTCLLQFYTKYQETLLLPTLQFCKNIQEMLPSPLYTRMPSVNNNWHKAHMRVISDIKVFLRSF